MAMGNSSESESCDFRCLTVVALCPDPDAFELAVFHLTDSLGHLSTEECTYFNVIRGELKLRVKKPNHNKDGELIAYKRVETPLEGVYLAEGSSTFVQNVDLIRNTLRVSISELGTLNVKRRVFTSDQITINLDKLEGIGTYAEIDLGIATPQPTEADYEQIKRIQDALGIKQGQLVPYSYLELFRKLKLSDSGLDDESNQSDG
uniref:CYTH domain-containing protein n=1 Tax=Panagrolaimus sp. JU765 TaxID=591449 RepID=A0AC34QYG6_9BILA